VKNVERQNVTISAPSAVVRQARVIAAELGTSISALLSGMLEEMVESEHGYREAERRNLERLREGLDLGTRRQPVASRDELHER
jgi:hypothetical protein